MAALVPLVTLEEASPEVRAVFEDILTTRKVDRVNNFWRALAFHPATLRRVWEAVRDVMAPGALDARTKEMLYLAVSITNNCSYCTHSHLAAARKHGMTDEMYGELMAVIALANENNQLANGYQVPVDEQFLPKP